MSDRAPTPIHGLTSLQLRSLAQARVPRGAGLANRLYRQALCDGRLEPSKLGLSAEACNAWLATVSYELPRVVRTVGEQAEYADGAGSDEQPATTAKAIIDLGDGLEVECVHIPMGRNRFTLCVSSQVGCAMGCRFCETGRMGRLRDLAVHEIVGQLLVARQVLGWTVTNIVFMGMGEPLDNLAGVLGALRVFTDQAGLGMAQERLTVCTVGHADHIRELAAAGLRRVDLSLSLNAANDALRSQLMPINRRFPLAEVQAALIAFRPRDNFCFGINYCLMPELNDRPEHAKEIADFLAPLGRCLLNLIPYNPGNQPLTRAPEEYEIEQFIGWLREAGVAVRRRITKGRSVMAACGQLGNAELRAQRRRAAAAAAVDAPTNPAD